MISDGKQDLANDLHDLSFHTLKIDHTFTTFVCQLTSLRDGLERHGGLERFSGAVADVLLKLRGLHQRYQELVRRSRQVACDVQSRFEDFKLILPLLHGTSVQWCDIKAEIEVCLKDMYQKEAVTRQIADDFYILTIEVQEASSLCEVLHRHLKDDLKRKHQQNLQDYLCKLKDSAKNLPGLLFDMLSGGAEDGISTIIMTVAPPICLGALYSSIFFYRRWLIKKEGTRFGAVDEPEWQDGCTQLDERSSTSWNAWKGILNEMQSLRTLLAIQAEEGPIAPLSHVNTRLHEKASMYADVNVSLRQYQVSVI